MPQKLLIFSDMDGTLLDHFDYSFAPVLPLLKKFSQLEWPVIPNTSKTFAELIELNEQIGLNQAFIVENGAAVYLPINSLPNQPTGTYIRNGYWVKNFSHERAYWLDKVEQLKVEFSQDFQHFAQMTITDICESTGLNPAQAEKAAERQFGEPVLWLGSEQSKRAFIQAAIELGASPLQGGRFIHICGQSDKGKALTWLTNEYKAQLTDYHIQTVALGDSQNDVAMLEAADMAVRIASPTHELPSLERSQGIFTSSLYGPKGWAEVMQTLSNHLLSLDS